MPFLIVPPRQVARPPVHGEAAGWIDEPNASILCRSPRTPHAQKAPPTGRGTASSGGHQHRFSLFREAVTCTEGCFPWMNALWGGALLGSTKTRAAFANLPLPRNGLLFPRNGPFSPRVHFSAAPLLLPLSLSFQEEGEGKEGGKGRVAASTGRKCKPWLQNLRPVEKTGIPRKTRGCTTNRFPNEINDVGDARWSIPASTGDLPLYSPAPAPAGGVHGVR